MENKCHVLGFAIYSQFEKLNENEYLSELRVKPLKCSKSGKRVRDWQESVLTSGICCHHLELLEGFMHLISVVEGIEGVSLSRVAKAERTGSNMRNLLSH